MSRLTRAGIGKSIAKLVANGLLWLAAGTAGAMGQQASTPPQNGPGDGVGPPPMEGRRPPMERAFHFGPHGRWWNNPEVVKKLGLTADQQKRMEAVTEQNRPGLMNLSTTLRQEEMAMGPLLGADSPDETKILAQIDRIAQARAELEKANARMLLGLRRLLTPDQWKTLQADETKGEFGGYHPHWPMGPPGPDAAQPH